MVRVTQCCCGCTLKTGTIIIGSLYAVGYLLNLFVSIVPALTNIDQTKKEFLAAGIPEETIQLMKVILYVGLVYSIIGTLLSFVLLHGALQDNSKAIFFWLVTHTALQVIQALTVIIIVIAFAVDTALQIAVIAQLVITIPLSLYFILVIYSFYQELRDPTPKPTIVNQPVGYSTPPAGYSMPPAYSPPA